MNGPAAPLDRPLARLERERLLAAVVDSSSDALMCVDPDGRIVAWNRTAHTLLGYSADEVLGENVSILIPPERRAARAPLYRVALEGERLGPQDTIALCKDGSHMRVAALYNPLRENGQIIGVVVGLRDLTDRQRADKVEGLYQLLADHVADVILLLDPSEHAEIKYASPAAERILGYRPDELIGQSAHLITTDGHPLWDDGPGGLRRWLSGEPDLRTFRGRRKDGRVIWLEAESRAVLDDTGRATEIVCVQREVTKRIAAQRKLERSEEQFRLLAENSSDKIMRASMDGTVLYVSPAVGEFGWRQADWVGRNVTDFTHPDDEEMLNVELEALAAGDRRRQVRYRLKRKDGTYRTLSSQVRSVCDHRGIPQEIITVSRDVTDTERAAEHLADVNHRLTLMVDNVTDVVSVISADGLVSFLSPSVRELYGHDPDMLSGRDVLDLVHPDDRAQYRRELDELVDDGPRTWEFRFLHADGRWVWSESTGRAVRRSSGAVEVHTSTRDISDRKAVEEQLRASNAELAQFAYAASHDLQEPLRVIGVSAELLERSLDDNEIAEARELVASMRQSAGRMSELIDDLLRLSRVGSEPLRTEQVCLQDVCAAAIGNLKVAIAESAATVDVQDLPCVLGDGVLLTQLLQNLIGNAVKFHEPGVRPQVTVSAVQNGDHWQVQVTDNGIGVDAAHQDRIFRIFQRLYPQGQYPGTGVGLALCQRIVSRHSGRIGVISQPGQGATFWFTLPGADSAERQSS